MTLEERMEEYRKNVPLMTEREKALEENAIWHMVVEQDLHIVDGRRYLRRDWLQKMLGVTMKESERRQIMANAGAVVEPIWQEIEQRQMHPQSAAHVLSDAKRISAQERVPLEVAIEMALKDYNARPLAHKLDGYIVRRRGPSPRGYPRPPRDTIRAAKAKGPTDTHPHKDSSLFSHIRKEILEHVESKLEHSPAFVADSIANNFIIGLKVLLDELRRNVKSATYQDPGFLHMSSSERRRVVAACRALDVTPPKVGRPVDMKVVRQNWRNRAMEYHPDRNAATADVFVKVNEAYDELKKYNAKIQKKETTDGDTDGDSGDSGAEAQP